ncbi:hypothetical protein DQZ30_18925 [Salmonella enterica subsp. diarizonae]|nr:hypothetical protein [Salmonella enterica subsp. diarizonae]ECI4530950.1 hypothetical protein [Salmonella enterica subsp. diarizonae]
MLVLLWAGSGAALFTTTKKRKDSLNDAFVEHVQGIVHVYAIRDHLFLAPKRSHQGLLSTEAQ